MDLCNNRSFSHTRRDALRSISCGFGLVALAGIAAQAAGMPFGAPPAGDGDGPLSPKAPHHPAKAKRIIFLLSLIHI